MTCPSCSCPVYKVVGRYHPFKRDGSGLEAEPIGRHVRCLGCNRPYTRVGTEVIDWPKLEAVA